MDHQALVTLQQHLLQTLPQAPNEARRLLHGRGRLWPGLEQLTVDWLQGVLLVTLFRDPGEEWLAALRTTLQRLTASPVWAQCGARQLLLQHRYRADCANEWLYGPPVERWQVEEEGLRYQLELGRTQNSGLFLDMRLGRRWVREQAEGARVLNLFAYTCAFSVAALAGGAQQVVNLDMSSAALARGRENHQLNDQELGRVRFLAHDLLKSWSKVARHGPYELIIIDPPTFQRGSFVLEKDYRKVLRRLPALLTERGRVLACVNDPAIGSDFLIAEMAREAPELRFVERLANPEEFADADPQGGLKALVFSRAWPPA
ncbi:class I SAM-dependent methyltransferase [Pseudomonas sp. NW5]|uniref:class I SAM-dependent methyltransferase n=1 Tax=Pseudomonas sp. NW5 TaxID=2934934 RepID=UPI0020213028|nr:class I SAM-dependent methyltransferase [Pseudomonas sp. NW5]MCL7461298.1 class I SAM-dependent methyltransferase [Pseudomonas sp. NW5]